MSLFEAAEAENRRTAQPLAARMRPRTLAEFAGQQSWVDKHRVLLLGISYGGVGVLAATTATVRSKRPLELKNTIGTMATEVSVHIKTILLTSLAAGIFLGCYATLGAFDQSFSRTVAWAPMAAAIGKTWLPIMNRRGARVPAVAPQMPTK